jgi:vitamin B12/bleomycin/antimicrobial peptide transport system ATP-binding/permease protein
VDRSPASRDPEGSQSRPPVDAASDPAVGRLRRTLPDAWRIIRPYWVSDDRWPGLGLLLVIVALTLGMVYLSVLLNRWNNDFFSALQEKNSQMFRRQLAQVAWLVGAFIVLAVYQLYLNQML